MINLKKPKQISLPTSHMNPKNIIVLRGAWMIAAQIIREHSDKKSNTSSNWTAYNSSNPHANERLNSINYSILGPCHSVEPN